MRQIIVNDPDSFYFGCKAGVLESQEINGETILRVIVGNVTFALWDSMAIDFE